jgi:hypothetical protein
MYQLISVSIIRNKYSWIIGVIGDVYHRYKLQKKCVFHKLKKGNIPDVYFYNMESSAPLQANIRADFLIFTVASRQICFWLVWINTKYFVFNYLLNLFAISIHDWSDTLFTSVRSRLKVPWCIPSGFLIIGSSISPLAPRRSLIFRASLSNLKGGVSCWLL